MLQETLESRKQRLMENLDKKRACYIKKWREGRQNDGEEPTNCVFNITTPKYVSFDSKSGPIENQESIKIITDLFDKYGIEWQRCDTVEGSFSLNRDWIETTTDIPCYIEYSGVYPVNWSPEDCRTLEKLDALGQVIINVLWHEDDKYIPNH